MVASSIKAPADYRPLYDAASLDRKDHFRRDGIVHYGLCTLDGVRCYFYWIDEIRGNPMPWVKIKYFDTVFKKDLLLVDRNFPGVRVYGIWKLTAQEDGRIDTWHRTYAEVNAQIPDRKSADFDMELRRRMIAQGFERYRIVGNDVSHEIRTRTPDGYFFLEDPDLELEVMFRGTEYDSTLLDPEKRKIVEAAPLMAD